jgi:transcriptional regulator with XRE-family HTH domain
MADQSPTVRKLLLGSELRKLRFRAGITMEDAAEHVSRTDSTLSRLETGKSLVPVKVLVKLLNLYGASDAERDTLLAVATEARKPGWWHTYTDVLAPDFDVYIGLESAANALWIYEPEVIPGIMQTEGYMRALAYAEPIQPPEHAIEGRVEVRLKRQERFTTGQQAPALWVILNEAALHREVGGRKTMCTQLDHLLELSRLSNTTLQVLPFSAGAHPSIHTGGFMILSVGLDESTGYEIVYMEHRTGGLYIDKRAEVDGHKLVFDHLRAMALDREKSRALIRRVLREMTRE